jgi:hypothetical protein
MTRTVSENSLTIYHWLLDNNILPKRRLQVYECLLHKGPLTRNEICRELRFKGMVKPHYDKRLVEMERMGILLRVGERLCEVSGNTCDLWDTSNKYPSSFCLRPPEPSKELLLKVFYTASLFRKTKLEWALEDEEDAPELEAVEEAERKLFLALEECEDD